MCKVRYSIYPVSKVRLTCQVQSEGDEAMIARKELKRFFPLHQSPKVIRQSFTIEEVVDTNQEIPEEEGFYA